MVPYSARYPYPKTPRSEYQKRHYELVAGKLAKANELFGDTARGRTILAWLMVSFAKTFNEDNKSFDIERFQQACGFTQSPVSED